MKESNVKIFSPFVEEKVDDNAMLDTSKIEYLKGNPFLYNSLTSPYIIDSIEEYKVKYKKEFVSFGSMIRNATYSKNKRRRITKKVFKELEKDAGKFQEKKTNESLSIVENSSNISYKRFSKLMIFILIMSLILLMTITSFINGFILTIFDSVILERISAILSICFETQKWMFIVMNITLYTIIVTLIYSRFYGIVSKDFIRNTMYAQGYLERNTKNLDREYSRKISKAKKYYLNNIKTKNYVFAPYPMNLVGEGKLSSKNIESISNAILEKTTKFKKNKLLFTISKYVLIIISISGSLMVISFSIYEVIKNLVF